MISLFFFLKSVYNISKQFVTASTSRMLALARTRLGAPLSVRNNSTFVSQGDCLCRCQFTFTITQVGPDENQGRPFV